VTERAKRARPRIQEREVRRAKILASRVRGVTVQQLALALGCQLHRARRILRGLGAQATPLGTSAGQAAKTLAYRIRRGASGKVARVQG
jgi:hypothetical protein